MKRTHFIYGLVLVVAAIVAMSSVSYAGRYSKPKPYVDRGIAAGGEKTTSMSDCMSFCSSFVGGSMSKSRAMFNKQFGAPVSVIRGVSTYNYEVIRRSSSIVRGGVTRAVCSSLIYVQQLLGGPK